MLLLITKINNYYKNFLIHDRYKDILYDNIV